MIANTHNVVEFYLTGHTKPFCVRSGLLNTPRVGETLDVSGVTGEVVTVNWNLDYEGEAHEQWRCSIYVNQKGGDA